MSVGNKRDFVELFGASDDDSFEPCGPLKRPRRGREFPVRSFVANFSANHGLLESDCIKQSELGRKCVGSAIKAREEFQDWLHEKEPEIDITKLSADEKYARRVRNNRKSAAGAKVFEEVLAREIVTTLRNTGVETSNQLHERLKSLSEEYEKLKQEEEDLNNAVQAEVERHRQFQESYWCSSAIIESVNMSGPGAEGQLIEDEERLPFSSTLMSIEGIGVASQKSVVRTFDDQNSEDIGSDLALNGMITDLELDGFRLL